MAFVVLLPTGGKIEITDATRYEIGSQGGTKGRTVRFYNYIGEVLMEGLPMDGMFIAKASPIAKGAPNIVVPHPGAAGQGRKPS